MNGSRNEKVYLYQAQQEHIQEDCLVDIWIGQGRMAFIDLSAGPFEWGPTIGEGARIHSSIPHLPSKTKKKMNSISLKQLEPNSNRRFELYKTEFNILKEFWNQYCNNINNNSFCVGNFF